MKSAICVMLALKMVIPIMLFVGFYLKTLQKLYRDSHFSDYASFHSSGTGFDSELSGPNPDFKDGLIIV
jgi:hypothetical protein